MPDCRRIVVLFVGLTGAALAVVRADYPVTDLVDAAKRGDEHAVHRLIEQGADLNARDPMAYTALHWAGIRGHWEVFSELVAAGAPVNAVGADGGTPLHWTCHHDRPAEVRLLLEAGADLSVANQWGRTPLHVAARRGCLAVAELLLQSGADPNATTNEGWTPMHVAALSGNVDVMDLLEEYGADPTRADAEHLTPRRCWRRRPAALALDTTHLAEYEGIYDLGGGFSFKVWIEGDRLLIREFAPDELYPVGPDEFSCRREPWRVRFLRGADGEVTTIEVDFLRRTVRAEKTGAPRYVGSRVCISCHGDSDIGRQSVPWMRSRHAIAYWRLGSEWAFFLARLRPHYQDLEDPMTDDRCLLCHVAGAQDPDALFAPSFRAEDGVGCEACHGPGSLYADAAVMADREAFVAAGGRIPDVSTCRGCHRNSDNFDWDEWWPRIAHPRPSTGTRDEG